MPPDDSAARDLVLAWSSRLDGGWLTSPLPWVARDLLLERYRVLEGAFAQLSGAMEHIREMLSPFRSHPEAGSYAYVLAQTIPAPVWAIAGACNRVRRGEVGSPDFAPTPGRLRGVAWHIAEPYWVECATIRKIVMAKPPRPHETKEQRQRAAARILAEYRAAMCSQ
jgi:hypothetical protein